MRPLQAAPLPSWQQLAGTGTVLPVRRTDASLPLAGNSITVTALGLPASGLALLRGWRADDGSAPLHVLARRLAPDGPVRTPGPMLAPGTGQLAIRARARGGEVQLTAELRAGSGAVTAISLGTVRAAGRVLRGAVPPAGGRTSSRRSSSPSRPVRRRSMAIRTVRIPRPPRRGRRRSRSAPSRPAAGR